MQYNDITNELGENFIEYAAAINEDRAIPDSSSGLKPVARRILWSTYDSGFLSSKPHVKSAKIVGNIIGTLHPHGDVSVYDALVHLSRNWIMRYPLMDIHGNNGNISGDDAASMRYTEARLSAIAEEGMLNGIKKKNVDFVPNYDETEEEPATLPALFPNLLCNPNNGIGVSLSCSWAPHNFREVAQAIFDYMDGKEATLPGPDFPTGGVVINKDDIPRIMKTGHGSVKIRGQYKIENRKIIFYEIPYGTTIEQIMAEIGEVCDKNEIEGISEIRDESNKNGVRIVIEYEKGASPEEIVKLLFAKTDLQSSFSYNQIALVDKTPTELNLNDCLRIYVDHNLDCIVREANFDLQKATERQHIVVGLLHALEDIDNIIALIKNSENAGDARKNLMSKYGFSEAQSKAIVDMKLGRLAGLEKVELQKENSELLNTIGQLTILITSPELQKKELREELQKLVDKYGDDRRTALTQVEEEKASKEKIIVPEDVIVTLSTDGAIKRVPASKVRKKSKNKEKLLFDPIATNTVDTLMLFTQSGLMYKLSVDDVPEGIGTNINNLVELKDNDKIIAGTAGLVRYAVFVTKRGLVKKTLLSEYEQIKRKSGTIAIKIKDGDSIANISFMDEEDLILVTKKGTMIRFQTKDIAPIGRNTSGVKGIKLNEDDEVLIGLPIHKETDMLVVLEERGTGKKWKLADFACQARNGKGILITKEPIVGAILADDKDTLLLETTTIPVAKINNSSNDPLVRGTVKHITKLRT